MTLEEGKLYRFFCKKNHESMEIARATHVPKGEIDESNTNLGEYGHMSPGEIFMLVANRKGHRAPEVTFMYILYKSKLWYAECAYEHLVHFLDFERADETR